MITVFARSLGRLFLLLCAVPFCSVSAATYIAQLDYRASGNSVAQGTPYGSVLIEELTATTIRVTVSLVQGVGFVDTGGPHTAFAFGLTGDYDVALAANTTGQSFGSPTYNASGVSSTPFGNFTNIIACCGNGASNQSPPPLIFTITDANGITVVGQGATFDGNGLLTAFGTGDHLLSSTNDYLFAADVVQGSTTGNVAAKSLSLLPSSSVPEPASWLMMVGGFGLAGALLRSRRRSSVDLGRVGGR